MQPYVKIKYIDKSAVFINHPICLTAHDTDYHRAGN